jgi:hypothetical protein
MTKWGDLLISAVAYDQKHRVTFVKQHKDTGDSIEEGEIIDGASLASNIKNGKSCVTIYSTLSNWKFGEKLRTYNLDGGFFIRNDTSKVTSDNLGSLKELKVSDKGEEIPETPSLEEKPKPAPKIIPNVPPKVPPKPLPTPEPQKAPELESTPSSSKGSLPKPESAAKPSPSKPVEKEATSEEIKKVEKLEKQINELGKVKESTPKVKPTLSKSKEGLDNKIEQLKELSDQISELEQKVEKIEKPKNQPGKSSSGQGIQVEAYCVKCKSKRTIKDPFETTLKNGRSAIKGKCVECGTNVCRMGKIPKK